MALARRFAALAAGSVFIALPRRWAERAVARGALTVVELRNGVSEACTPQRHEEDPVPLSGTGSSDRSAPEQQKSFAIQVSQSLVKRMMFRDFLLAFGEQDGPRVWEFSDIIRAPGGRDSRRES
jgi:hypothetical protein